MTGLSYRYRAFACLAVMAMAGPACGVKQFNASLLKKQVSTTSSSQNVKEFGPFQGAAQGQGSLTPPTCGTAGTRPCIRARVNVGMAYHFDANSNATKGIANQPGGQFQNGPYVTQAGAGKTVTTSGPRMPDAPRIENKDLKMLGRQPADSTTHTF